MFRIFIPFIEIEKADYVVVRATGLELGTYWNIHECYS